MTIFMSISERHTSLWCAANGLVFVTHFQKKKEKKKHKKGRPNLHVFSINENDFRSNRVVYRTELTLHYLQHAISTLLFSICQKFLWRNRSESKVISLSLLHVSCIFRLCFSFFGTCSLHFDSTGWFWCHALWSLIKSSQKEDPDVKPPDN